ncbi:MAG: GNAT family protein [Bacteroidales bacterium]|nr:GNAT family protein [Bacteroidales bacterium]
MLEEHCFHCLNIHQIYVKTAENNKPALALFTKAGFEKCGVLTDWLCRGNQFSNAVLLQRIAD